MVSPTALRAWTLFYDQKEKTENEEKLIDKNEIVYIEQCNTHTHTRFESI